MTNKPSDELIGPSFDAQAIYNTIGSAQHPPARQQHPHRPPPLLHSATLDPRLLSPKLRQSQSSTALGRKMERITPPRSDSGMKSPRQRWSDEAKPETGKKKGIFSSMMNGVLGSPRRPTISTPTNPMHVTHVSIDNETGQYTVSHGYSLTRGRAKTHFIESPLGAVDVFVHVTMVSAQAS